MRNVIGQPVIGDDLYGREYELTRIWELLEQGEHLLMLAPRRVGKTSLMLELRRAPREGWDVLYVDIEKGDSPADCVAAILATLAADPRYRSRFEAIPFSSAIKECPRRACPSASMSTFCASSSRTRLAGTGTARRTRSRRAWQPAGRRPQAPDRHRRASDPHCARAPGGRPPGRGAAAVTSPTLAPVAGAPGPGPYPGWRIDRTRRSPPPRPNFRNDQRSGTISPGLVGGVHGCRLPG